MQINRSQPTEKILWSGQPRQGFIFKKVDFYFLVPGIVFLYLISFNLSPLLLRELKNSNYDYTLLIAIIWLIFFCFYILIGRNILDKYRRYHTRYKLTNKNIIITYKDKIVFKKPIIEINAALSLFEKNYGAIMLGKSISEFDMQNHDGGYSSKNVLCSRFENIPNAIEVYELLIEAQNNYSEK